MINIGVIGFGHWGPNLVRAFARTAGVNLLAIAEGRTERHATIQELYPEVAIHTSGEDIVNHPDIQAVVVATPTFTHYPLARLAIENGKHVLVEKPLTSVSSEANDLVELAERHNTVLMVDHILLYTGAAKSMAQAAHTGELGTLQYFDATRYAFGLFQPDVNVLWDLAPHDIAVMLHVQPEKPVAVQATGVCHTGNGIENIAHMTLKYASGFMATFRTSWSCPYKLRLTLLGGSKGIASWDDMLPEEKLRIYKSSYEHQVLEEGKRIAVQYQQDGYTAPELDGTEPLLALAADFVHAINTGGVPISSGALGADVVRILEAAELSIKNNGMEIALH